jgi:hypothetical protein
MVARALGPNFYQMRPVVLILAIQAIAGAGLIHAESRATQSGSDSGVKGEYYNADFGYSVVVPKTLTAHTASGPGSSHGFGIDLHLNPPAYLSVDGSRNDQGWANLEQAIEARVNQVREKNGTHIVVLEREGTHLAGLRAIRFMLRYDTPESRDPMVQEVILAFRKEVSGPDLVYTIALTGPEYLVSRNHKYIEQIKKTWKLKPLP